MKTLSCCAAFLFALCTHAVVCGDIVTENFSGSGAMISPGTGNLGTGYTFNVTDTVGCVTVDFNVMVTTDGGGDLFADTNGLNRGFGDATSNVALQNGESLEFTFSTPVISLSAAAPTGSFLTGVSTFAAEFTSFDLTNNGTNSPIANWTTNTGSGTATSTGTAGGFDFPVSVTAGSTTLNVENASGAWAWINNIQFDYSGGIEVDKPSAVPEPNSFALAMLLGLGFISTRRRS